MNNYEPDFLLICNVIARQCVKSEVGVVAERREESRGRAEAVDSESHANASLSWKNNLVNMTCLLDISNRPKQRPDIIWTGSFIRGFTVFHLQDEQTLRPSAAEDEENIQKHWWWFIKL